MILIGIADRITRTHDRYRHSGSNIKSKMKFWNIAPIVVTSCLSLWLTILMEIQTENPGAGLFFFLLLLGWSITFFVISLTGWFTSISTDSRRDKHWVIIFFLFQTICLFCFECIYAMPDLDNFTRFYKTREFIIYRFWVSINDGNEFCGLFLTIGSQKREDLFSERDT